MFRTDAQQARGWTMAGPMRSKIRGLAREGGPSRGASRSPERAPLAEPPIAERPGGFFRAR